MRKMLPLLFFVLLTVSCSQDLDRNEAKELLSEFYDYPSVELVGFTNVINNEQINNEFAQLRQFKLIDYNTINKYVGTYRIRLSSTGNAYSTDNSLNKVASSVLELNEITGIKLEQDNKSAIVKYNLVRKKTTPFGKAKKYNNGDVIEKEARMELYDDGWRITDAKPKQKLKEQDFQGFNENYLSNISKIANEITNESSQSPCLINKVYEKYGQTFIQVDYIQRKWVEQDGMEGFKIVNTNPKLRTFQINSSTQLIPEMKIEDLKKYYPTDNYKQDFDITVRNGEVISLRRNDAG